MSFSIQASTSHKERGRTLNRSRTSDKSPKKRRINSRSCGNKKSSPLSKTQETLEENESAEETVSRVFVLFLCKHIA